MKTKTLLSLFGLLLFFAHTANATAHLEHYQEIRSALGLDRYPFNNQLAGLKIAVIDNGFAGLEEDKKLLPDSAELVLKYDVDFIKKFNLGDPEYSLGPSQTEHGRIMAQIVWAATGLNAQGPKFYLLNANGITNFRRAVRYAIEEKVDIILYSQNRECCGNFDGRGFLNDIVNQAVSAGILWVNAAGNYGGNVYNGPVQVGRTQFKIKSNLDENFAQLILTWNDSGAEETSGTEKDLDLYIYDESGKEVAKSTLKQVLKKDALAEGETFLPRERIRFEFGKNKSGTYIVHVKTNGSNFTGSDKIRLVLIPEKQPIFDKDENKMVEAISLLDATPGGEIMVPADNPGVITVGDLSTASSRGPTVDGRNKPEILLENSQASFTNGQSSSGTSNAAAYFTGVLAVLKSYRPGITRAEILAFPKKSKASLQIEKITLGEFALMHKRVLDAVETMASESPVLAGRFRDGRYVLGIRQNPSSVLSSICGNSSKETPEYYLAISSNDYKTLCFTRTQDSGANKTASYPWEYNGGDRHAFVEIRQVFLSLGPISPNDGTWLTPAPEQLK